MVLSKFIFPEFRELCRMRIQQQHPDVEDIEQTTVRFYWARSLEGSRFWDLLYKFNEESCSLTKLELEYLLYVYKRHSFTPSKKISN